MELGTITTGRGASAWAADIGPRTVPINASAAIEPVMISERRLRERAPRTLLPEANVFPLLEAPAVQVSAFGGPRLEEPGA
jgi:hypothetical protein